MSTTATGTDRTPAVGPPAPPAATRVVYIMGAGRSGSTVLGVALGSCAGVFYAGELDAWLRRAGRPNFHGQRRERLWREIRAGVPDARDMFGDEAWRTLEHSLAALRIHRWRAARRLRPRYRRLAGELYRQIAASAAARVILDSSHYPLRARELQHVQGIELYLIYLVRDPAAVVGSFAREDLSNPSKGRLASECYLWLTHLLATFVFLAHGRDRRLLVRYEDFAASPERTLARIAGWAGVDGVPESLGDLQTGLAFQGNRLLDSETVTITPRTVASGSRALPLTWAIQSPWRIVHRLLAPALTVARGSGDGA